MKIFLKFTFFNATLITERLPLLYVMTRQHFPEAGILLEVSCDFLAIEISPATMIFKDIKNILFNQYFKIIIIFGNSIHIQLFINDSKLTFRILLPLLIFKCPSTNTFVKITSDV